MTTFQASVLSRSVNPTIPMAWRRIGPGILATPAPSRNEWVVRFAYELPEDVACSTEMAIVLVDDATGEAQLIDSL